MALSPNDVDEIAGNQSKERYIGDMDPQIHVLNSRWKLFIHVHVEMVWSLRVLPVQPGFEKVDSGPCAADRQGPT